MEKHYEKSYEDTSQRLAQFFFSFFPLQLNLPLENHYVCAVNISDVIFISPLFTSVFSVYWNFHYPDIWGNLR